MTPFPARPTIPARPAAYIRNADATTAGDPGMTAQCNMVISLVQDLGWPTPAVYADPGQPGLHVRSAERDSSRWRRDEA